MSTNVRKINISQQGDNKKLVINLLPDNDDEGKIVDIECVIDTGEFGNILGVEILSIAYYAGSNCLNELRPASLENEGFQWSFDEEADAAYFRLFKGRSLDQRDADCRLYLDLSGHATKLEVDWK